MLSILAQLMIIVRALYKIRCGRLNNNKKRERRATMGSLKINSPPAHKPHLPPVDVGRSDFRVEPGSGAVEAGKSLIRAQRTGSIDWLWGLWCWDRLVVGALTMHSPDQLAMAQFPTFSAFQLLMWLSDCLSRFNRWQVILPLY